LGLESFIEVALPYIEVGVINFQKAAAQVHRRMTDGQWQWGEKQGLAGGEAAHFSRAGALGFQVEVGVCRGFSHKSS
jgi:hypothetical protein